MIIRVSDPIEDSLGLIEGAQDFVRRMDWAPYFPKDEEEFVAAMSVIFTAEYVETVVAEHEGKIVAGLGMIYLPHIFNPKVIHAEEVFWWASEKAPKTAGLRLLKYVKNRAKEKGASVLTFSKLTSTPDKVDKVYKRLGLEPREIRYSGEI